VLKYFIDMLKFPESQAGITAGFVGLAAGEWGGLRAVEQIELVFQYRLAHLYGRRVFFKQIHTLLDESGRLTDPTLVARLEKMVNGFVTFCREVGASD
jgi:NAD(P)H-dependent FMN reductase